MLLNGWEREMVEMGEGERMVERQEEIEGEREEDLLPAPITHTQQATTTRPTTPQPSTTPEL